VKEGALKFLGRCLSTSPSPIQPPQVKPLADNLATLLEDGFEGARNEAAICLGILMKMVGERPLNALMDGLADVRKAKVREAFEKAVVRCKVAAPKAAPPSKPVASKVGTAKVPATKATPTNKITSSPSIEDDKPQTTKPAAKPPVAAAVSRRIFSIVQHTNELGEAKKTFCSWRSYSICSKKACGRCAFKAF